MFIIANEKKTFSCKWTRKKLKGTGNQREDSLSYWGSRALNYSHNESDGEVPRICFKSGFRKLGFILV